jgi:hypothetical protein
VESTSNRKDDAAFPMETRLSLDRGRWRVELLEGQLVAEGADLRAVADEAATAVCKLVTQGGLSPERATTALSGLDAAVAHARAAAPVALPAAVRPGVPPLGAAIPVAAGIVVGIIALWLGSWIGALTHPMQALADPKEAGRMLTGVIDHLARTAESITPERQQQMVQDTRTVVKWLLPLVRELRPLGAEPPAEPAPERRSP